MTCVRLVRPLRSGEASMMYNDSLYVVVTTGMLLIETLNQSLPRSIKCPPHLNDDLT